MGFTVSKTTKTIRFGGPVTRLVYNFDDIDDFVSIQSYNVSVDEAITVKFIAPTAILGSSGFIIDGDTSSTNRGFITFKSDGTIGRASQLGRLYLDGIMVVNNTTPYPLDGLPHVLEVRGATGSCQIATIGAEYRRDRSFANLVIYDVDLGGNRFYPIDDGWANNPTIRDTVAGKDGTANNFNSERWEEVNV